MSTVINKKSMYRSKLANILNFRNIDISQAELRSYSTKELKFLINTYDVKLNNANNPTNFWYRTAYTNYQHS